MPDAPAKMDDAVRRGYEWYDRSIRSRVETQDNIGKLIMIDVSNGDYEIGEDGITIGRRLQERNPGAELLCLRIGYNAVYSLGGVLTRTKI